MKNIGRIILISKPLHGLVVLISFLILLQAMLQLVAPLLSKSIVDQITAKLSGQPSSVERLIQLIVFAFFASFAGTITKSISDRLGDHFAGKLRQHLIEKFYDKVLTLPQSYFDGHIAGKIMNQLNRGMMTIYGFLNGATNFMLPTFVSSILTVAILFYYNVPIGFFVFILFPIYILLSYRST